MSKIFSKGIDISEHQGSVDFNKLKASGIDFVLIRAGYGSANRYPEQYDARFEEYYKKAKYDDEFYEFTICFFSDVFYAQIHNLKYGGNHGMDIDMPTFKAIQRQLEELNWI